MEGERVIFFWFALEGEGEGRGFSGEEGRGATGRGTRGKEGGGLRRGTGSLDDRREIGILPIWGRLLLPPCLLRGKKGTPWRSAPVMD